MIKITVIDGQGGGIGSVLVKKMREEFGDSAEITALGTNAVATTAMMKAGADKGASGENAIVWNAGKVDIITGPKHYAAERYARRTDSCDGFGAFFKPGPKGASSP